MPPFGPANRDAIEYRIEGRYQSGAMSLAKKEKYQTSSGAPRPRSEMAVEQSVGLTVRRLRTSQDMSVGELAVAADISIGMLSKVENGQISPSLTTLEKLSGALNTPLSRLFADFDESRDCSYVPAGEGVAISRKGTKAGHEYRMLGATLAGDVSVEPYLITLAKNAKPYSQFQHEGTELIYMISGHVDYRHGDAVHQLKPGDTLMFDSAALHGPENLVELPATYLSVIVYPRH